MLIGHSFREQKKWENKLWDSCIGSRCKFIRTALKAQALQGQIWSFITSHLMHHYYSRKCLLSLFTREAIICTI